eukprot:CAMPEP_0169164160 /NCGR_PEP_ID=MMETSP1015-20121227/58682_1 /TAXON_ID=342587 /ORGANISM="Karlodinium micrum, Strain CCMP2283" /LENGTH=36 /DNA_ID= /DNA_START= /DNA_END= /DNA_ORIENTATION=
MQEVGVYILFLASGQMKANVEGKTRRPRNVMFADTD